MFNWFYKRVMNKFLENMPIKGIIIKALQDEEVREQIHEFIDTIDVNSMALAFIQDEAVQVQLLAMSDQLFIR